MTRYTRVRAALTDRWRQKRFDVSLKLELPFGSDIAPGRILAKRVFSGVIYGKDLWYFRLALDISSIPSFVFLKMPQVLSGLRVTLGGCCGVWGLSSGTSTGLVLIRRHACSCVNM